MESSETSSRSSVESLSPNEGDDRDNDYNPQSRMLHATPRARRLYGSSIASKQKERATGADPNNGRCLLTLQSAPVQACHLVPKSLNRSGLESLEWWWGLSYNTLNLDTRYNLIFLRADLHILLDNDHWMLVPELTTIDMILQWMVEQRETRRENILRYPTNQFIYRLVPLVPMDEITITRITRVVRNPQEPPLLQFEDHRYPFINLGPLKSHALPHFAIYNAGQKLPLLVAYSHPADMLEIFRQCMQIPTTDEARSYLNKITVLYQLWISAAPLEFKQGHYDAGFGGGGVSRGGGGPGSHGRSTRLSTSSRAGSGYGNTRTGQFHPQSNPGGRHVASLQYTDTSDLEEYKMDECHDTIDSDNEDDLLHDIAASKKFVSKWLKQTTKAVAHNGGWDTNVWNDDQLGSYVEEPPRPPGQEWHPTWMRRGLPDIHKPPPDTSKFSSNDWCLKDFFIRLPDPVHDIF